MYQLIPFPPAILVQKLQPAVCFRHYFLAEFSFGVTIHFLNLHLGHFFFPVLQKMGLRLVIGNFLCHFFSNHAPGLGDISGEVVGISFHFFPFSGDWNLSVNCLFCISQYMGSSRRQ